MHACAGAPTPPLLRDRVLAVLPTGCKFAFPASATDCVVATLRQLAGPLASDSAARAPSKGWQGTGGAAPTKGKAPDGWSRYALPVKRPKKMALALPPGLLTAGAGSAADGRRGAVAIPPVESQYVTQFYDGCAEEWDESRTTPWPSVEAFVADVQGDTGAALIADVGCGNGRFMSAFGIGVDASIELLTICARRGLHVVAADMACLPFRAGLFDAAVVIAALHHLSTEERRLAAVAEAMRIVRVGGRILLYAWCGSRDHQAVCQQQGTRDVLVPFTWASRAAAAAAAAGEGSPPPPDDAAAAAAAARDHRAAAADRHRYCHLFDHPNQLADLVARAARASGVRVHTARLFEDQGNVCAELLIVV